MCRMSVPDQRARTHVHALHDPDATVVQTLFRPPNLFGGTENPPTTVIFAHVRVFSRILRNLHVLAQVLHGLAQVLHVFSQVVHEVQNLRTSVQNLRKHVQNLRKYARTHENARKSRFLADFYAGFPRRFEDVPIFIPPTFVLL